VATRAVPKLKGGKSDFGTGGGALAGELPAGEYFAFICADFDDRVKEKKEGNNCLALEERVYVIEREWAGQLDGSGPTASGGSTTESWTSADASFQFSEYLGDGRFKYLFHGSVTYTVSGTDSEGCTYSGSDTTSLAGNAAGEGLILDLRKEEYFGGQGVPGFPFNWDYVCEGVPSQIGGPLSIAGGFIVVNPQEIDTHPLPFGSTTLTGSSTSDFNGSTFGWLLG
jgi:hypothetical protein